jgi:multiple sugar transport system substrate-binding protein
VKPAPAQNNPLNHPRLDRLLFYAALAVLGVALSAVAVRIRQGVPILGEEKRVLVFTQWWQDELDAAVLPAIIREFESQNPGISIGLDTRPYHEVRRLLLPDVSGPDAGKGAAGLPDILGLDPRWLPLLDEKDLFEPAGALPVVSWVIPLFYRTDFLREAGFDRPPKDLAEFTAAARAASDSPSGRYGFALSLSPEDPLGVYRDVLPWFRSSGISLVSGGRPAFTGASAAGVLSFLDALSREGLLSPGTFAKTNKDRLKDFAAGRLVMMLAPAAEIGALRAAGVPFGVTAVPGPASYIGKPAAGLAGWYAGIPRSGRYKDDARAFLSFLAAKAGGVLETAVAPGNGGVSSPAQDPFYLKINDLYAAAATTGDYLKLPGEPEMETILGEELRLMFEEGRSPEETARAVQKKWEAAAVSAQK